MADDDLRFGDVTPNAGGDSDPINRAIELLIKLMVLAVVLYAFYNVMLTLVL